MMISRFLPEGEHFTFDEILFLEILMYTSEETPFSNILDAEGKTVRELIMSIDESLLVDDKIYRGYLSGQEWKKILNVIKNRTRLLDIVIAETHMDEDYGGGGGLAAVMLSEKNKEAVVAFRGTATREWVDDFSGACKADTLQQLNALEWYRSVYRKLHLDRYYITLAGHSKGGNKAKYITIVDDTPDRCFSIDGQGFSDAFFETYGERILQRQDRIENHSIDYDSINALMTEIGKEYFYKGYDYGKLGYIETHSMGKFFKWENDGGYSIHPSRDGQSAEMLSLKHFFNSYLRSVASEEDKNEMAECLGLILQKSNEIKDARKEAEERSIRANSAGIGMARKEEDTGERNKEEIDTEEIDTEEIDTERTDSKGTDSKGTDSKGIDIKGTDIKERDVEERNIEEKNIEERDIGERNIEEKDIEERNIEGRITGERNGEDERETGKPGKKKRNRKTVEKRKNEENRNADFISFVCELIANPVYTDRVAFLIAFLIRYQRLHPEFIGTLKEIPEQFGMEEMGKYAQYLESVLNWKELDRAISMTGFLTEHLPKGLARQMQLKLNKSLNMDLTGEQFLCLLSIISRVKQYAEKLVICENPPKQLMTSEKEESLLNILVLAGGFSAERNISLQTGLRVAATLREMGHHVIFLDSYMGCTADDETLQHAFEHTEELSTRPFAAVDVMPDLWAVQKRRPGSDPAIIGPNVLRICKMADLVFVGLHNARGEYGKLQGALDLYGIRYTGDCYEASALAMNKDLTKRLLRYAGFDTPDWTIVRKTDWECELQEDGRTEPEAGHSAETEEDRGLDQLPGNLSFPVVVKPCCGGSGIGVSFAWDRKSYRKALKEAYRWEERALVEQFLPGREFSVSILEGKILPPAEICVPSGIYNYQTRFASRSAVFRCPVAEKEIREELCRKAEEAAEMLGITAYCRVDFRMSEEEKLMFLECDTLPEMTEQGLLQAEIEAAGISFEELCRSILNQTLKKRNNIEPDGNSVLK